MTRPVVARWSARAIAATRGVDVAYRRFDRLRSRAVIRLASDDVLIEYNAIAYQRDEVYDPGTSTFRDRLFPWEAAAIRKHFPPPPGQVLLGGAGGGREAFALAALGYEVVAFEPAPGLAAAMAQRALSVPGVSPFRARYQDLPRLSSAVGSGYEQELHAFGSFSCAVMGWASFAHLPSRQARLTALQDFARLTDGPILVSFLTMRSADGGARPDGRRGDEFSVFIGGYHPVDVAEIAELVEAAGLAVVAMYTDDTDSPWPHVVVRRARRNHDGQR